MEKRNSPHTGPLNHITHPRTIMQSAGATRRLQARLLLEQRRQVQRPLQQHRMCLQHLHYPLKRLPPIKGRIRACLCHDMQPCALTRSTCGADREIVIRSTGSIIAVACL
ncbi:hypothetical protein AA103581_2097 [Gluconobacter wancherniae NBRC 103581]|nr:hypothetical protein AA103581_2097 [Gluconobacter wancherniae NBRC 103581]